MTEYAGLPLAVKTHPRARRVLVKLVPGQGLEVVVPRGFDCGMVPEILDEKRTWIERTRDRLLAEGRDLSGRLPDLPEYLDFTACDRSYRVDYLDRQDRIAVVENVARLQVVGPVKDRAVIIDALRKFTAKKAREVLLPRLGAMSSKTGLSYSAMRIRRQKTRWGSCSARGTISLNAKLLFLSSELVDHLLLHELCHTVHLNHSAAYWGLVEKFEPDYLRLEDDLKRGGKFVPVWFG